MCDCLKLTIEAGTVGEQSFEVQASGTYNGYNYWEYTYDGNPIVIYWDGFRWLGADSIGGLVYVSAGSSIFCPEGSLTGGALTWTDLLTYPNLKTFTTTSCTYNCGEEDRTKKGYQSIKLPEIFQEQDRGLKDCCCKWKVLGDDGADTWKNDLSSAWIKLSDPSDTATFILKKSGTVANYVPTSNQFINEENAIYTTIDWGVVLGTDGEGCFTLEIEYSISGIVGTILWGTYDLHRYSVKNALNTARVRAIFDGYHEIEQINFSGSGVESTFRFCGYIGNRQPNTEIDNIIYQNREMKRVIRENLNSYEIITDPSDECIIRPLVDLYLLSENELFISDYNAHNHSYRYQDIAVIVSESPAVEYYDFSRKAKLTCTVSDKFKNKRTYY